MKRPGTAYHHLVFIALVFLTISGCSALPYNHESFDDFQIDARAETQQQGVFVVRASVPSREESEKLFGTAIHKRGIQAVWLEITNNSQERGRLALSSVDRDYFSPLEVAYMHKKYFSKQGWMDMEKYLYRTAIPRNIPAGATVSGFIYTHETIGTKAFNVDLFHTGGKNASYEEFTFFIQVPGFVPDHAEVDFEALYQASEVQELDSDGLRNVLRDIPCCTTNRDSTGQGKPINVVLVADGQDILRSLLRAGWSETTYGKDDNYLNSVNYLFDRPPDAVFRKSRGKSTERNELSLWMAPIRVDGTGVWMAQIKHAIGRRYKINEFFLGAAQDPDVDDGRNFLLQNLWYSQSLTKVGFLNSGKMVPMDNPEVDFNNDPYFTDGSLIVLWLSGEPVALQEARSVNWD